MIFIQTARRQKSPPLTNVLGFTLAHVRLTWWKCDLTDSSAMTRAKSVEVTGQIPFIATSLGRGDRRGVL